jgi:hypothetical protein
VLPLAEHRHVFGAGQAADLGRDAVDQPLLELEPVRVTLRHPRQLGDAEHPRPREVADREGTGERQQVVLADRPDRDPPQDDQLVDLDRLEVGDGPAAGERLRGEPAQPRADGPGLLPLGHDPQPPRGEPVGGHGVEVGGRAADELEARPRVGGPARRERGAGRGVAAMGELGRHVEGDPRPGPAGRRAGAVRLDLDAQAAGAERGHQRRQGPGLEQRLATGDNHQRHGHRVERGE